MAACYILFGFFFAYAIVRYLMLAPRMLRRHDRLHVASMATSYILLCTIAWYPPTGSSVLHWSALMLAALTGTYGLSRYRKDVERERT